MPPRTVTLKSHRHSTSPPKPKPLTFPKLPSVTASIKEDTKDSIKDIVLDHFAKAS